MHYPVYHLKPEALILQIVTEVNKKLIHNVLQVDLQDFRDEECIKGLFVGKNDAFSPVYPEQVGVPVPKSFSRGRNLIRFDKRDIKCFKEFSGTMDYSH